MGNHPLEEESLVLYSVASFSYLLVSAMDEGLPVSIKPAGLVFSVTRKFCTALKPAKWRGEDDTHTTILALHLIKVISICTREGKIVRCLYRRLNLGCAECREGSTHPLSSACNKQTVLA